MDFGLSCMGAFLPPGGFAVAKYLFSVSPFLRYLASAVRCGEWGWSGASVGLVRLLLPTFVAKV